MPRTIITQKTVFTFDELSDSAKETARAWYRDGALDYPWYDFIYEDAERVAAILGITFDRKTKNAPTIYFSGFWSQGDGACFEGSYAYAKGAPKAIRAYAPQDKELHRIADELQALQRSHFYRLTATMKQRGHYYHSGCMAVDVGSTADDSRELPEDDLIELMRDFADWIYKQLESGYDYLNSDEQIDESIRANGYEFDESGHIQ